MPLKYAYNLEFSSRNMSQDVSFNAKDYLNIIKWYEFAFGKGNDPLVTDRNTFTKLSAMAMGYTEEMKDIADEEDDKDV